VVPVLFLFWELFCLVLPPVGAGAATTGAGADVVVTGGAEFVVAGAALVVDGEELAAVDVALCAVAFLCAALCAFLALAVVVWAAGCVCGVAAAGVELDCELLDVPPQPATTRAAVIVLSSAFFIVPAP
jgi:hypothetical protein